MREGTVAVVVPDDAIQWSEAQLDARLGIACLVGEAVGYEGAANVVLREASEAFARGQDKEAKLLREMSTKLREVSVSYRGRQAAAQQEYDQLYKD